MSFSKTKEPIAERLVREMGDRPPATIAERLAWALHQRDMSMSAASENAGLGHSVLRTILERIVQPTKGQAVEVGTLAAFAKPLGVPLSWLVDGTGHEAVRAELRAETALVRVMVPVLDLQKLVGAAISVGGRRRPHKPEVRAQLVELLERQRASDPGWTPPSDQSIREMAGTIARKLGADRARVEKKRGGMRDVNAPQKSTRDVAASAKASRGPHPRKAVHR